MLAFPDEFPSSSSWTFWPWKHHTLFCRRIQSAPKHNGATFLVLYWYICMIYLVRTGVSSRVCSDAEEYSASNPPSAIATWLVYTLTYLVRRLCSAGSVKGRLKGLKFLHLPNQGAARALFQYSANLQAANSSNCWDISCRITSMKQTSRSGTEYVNLTIRILPKRVSHLILVNQRRLYLRSSLTINI